MTLFHSQRHRTSNGFGLIEVLLSIAILSALFITVSSKIDITDVFWKLGKTGHQTSVRAIGSAVKRYEEDHTGKLPGPAAGESPMITVSQKPICKQTVVALACSAAGGASITELTEDGKYLVEIPVDVDYEAPSELMTGYLIELMANGRVRVTAATNTGVTFTY